MGTPRSAAGYVLLSNADAAPGVVNLADIGSLEDSVWKVKFKVPGLRDVQCFTLSLRSPKAKKARKCSCKL